MPVSDEMMTSELGVLVWQRASKHSGVMQGTYLGGSRAWYGIARHGMFIVQHVRLGLARSLRVWARFTCAELGLATGDPGIWMLGVQQHTAQPANNDTPALLEHGAP